MTALIPSFYKPIINPLADSLRRGGYGFDVLSTGPFWIGRHLENIKPRNFKMFNFKAITLPRSLKAFGRDENGATAIEYGLFAALIGAVIVATVVTLGGQTNAGFVKVSGALNDAGITAPTDG